MKGIIFNLLEDVVSHHLDADVWDDVVEASGLSGAYSAIGSYGDGDFVTLLGHLPDKTGNDAGERLRWFGERAMPILADRYPVFFEGHTSTATFLPTLNDIIHPEVRKLYPGADVPVFDFRAGDDGVVHVGYRSTRRLCMLAEGFILGAARMFGQDAHVDQSSCMHRGADACLLVCSFSEAPARVG